MLYELIKVWEPQAWATLGWNMDYEWDLSMHESIVAIRSPARDWIFLKNLEGLFETRPSQSHRSPLSLRSSRLQRFSTGTTTSHRTHNLLTVSWIVRSSLFLLVVSLYILGSSAKAYIRYTLNTRRISDSNIALYHHRCITIQQDRWQPQQVHIERSCELSCFGNI